MITNILYSIIPFVVNYVFGLLFFSMLFLTLEVEVDNFNDDAELATGDEINDIFDDDHPSPVRKSHYMGYFGMIFFSVFRNSVGKLGFFGYNHFLSDKKPCLFWHVRNIWVVYFISVIVLFTMFLNFMVGVIENIYK